MNDAQVQQLSSAAPLPGWTLSRELLSRKGQTAAFSETGLRSAMSALIEKMRASNGNLIKHPELSIVSLVRPVVAEGMTLPSGSRGTVVHVYDGENAYIVEFDRPTHAVVTVEAGFVE